MGYATYDYYKNSYHGNVISDEETFLRVSVEADAYLDTLTRGKIKTATDAVKNAACAVCEVICMQSRDEETVVSSESVGNHSRSYTRASRTSAEREAEKYRKATLYLSRTGLLYRGLK